MLHPIFLADERVFVFWRCLLSQALSMQPRSVNLELSVHTWTIAAVSQLHSGHKCALVMGCSPELCQERMIITQIVSFI